MTETISFNKTQARRAFCRRQTPGDTYDASGNACLLTVLQGPPETPPALSRLTHCLTWPLGPKIAGVSCWTDQGVEIACCGHGLLCCATTWLTDWGGPGTLIMGGARVQCHDSEGLVWLGFEPLAYQPCEVPHWCKHYFDVEPTIAARAGPENGYLVLQWPQGFDLRRLRTPCVGLAQYTARSLIVTCAVSSVDTDNVVSDIQYRYFAPQYGVSEDAATGSAMRVLAGFWEHYGLGRSLRANQVSTIGGLLFSRIDNGKVWVGGSTEAIATETVRIE